MIDKVAVGVRIATLRKREGFSQKNLAAKIGVSAASLSWWENGKTELSYQAIEWYVTNFHVSSDYLLGLTDDPTFKTNAGNTMTFSTTNKVPDTNAEDSVAGVDSVIQKEGLPTTHTELVALVQRLVAESLAGQRTKGD